MACAEEDGELLLIVDEFSDVAQVSLHSRVASTIVARRSVWFACEVRQALAWYVGAADSIIVMGR